MDTLPFSQRPNRSPRAAHPDAALEFHSEQTLSRGPERGGDPTRWLAHLAVVVVLLVAGVWGYRTYMNRPPPTGILRIESEPSEAAVDINGSLRGLTPFRTTLKPGRYAVVVTDADRSQSLTVQVEPGVEAVHHVRLTRPRPAAPGPGRLHVTSETGSGMVTVNGVERGTTPLMLQDVEPGEHQIVVRQGGRTHRQTVTVHSDATSSIVIAGPLQPASPGWMVVRSSAHLDVFDRGRLLGSTDDERIVLPPGTYNLDFAADSLGFRTRRSVTVGAGAPTTVSVALPQSTVNFNATPWADVWINGKSVGQTPIANLLQTIGTHEVEFRHPQLGTKQVRVTVSLREPARVAVDMR
jgi:hypothetical protein